MRMLISSIALWVALSTVAHASEITFEDLFVAKDSCNSDGCGMQPVPAGYAGFDWSGYAWVINKESESVTPDTAYNFGTLGMMSLFTAYGAAISFGGGTFDFNGAYLTAHDVEPYELVVNGFRAGVLVYTKTVMVYPSTDADGFPRFYLFNFDDVDSVGIETGGNRWVVIDNIRINEPFEHGSPWTLLRQAVQDLLAVGVLQSGGANSLLVKVAAAEAATSRGLTETALRNLAAFAREVVALEQSGALTESQAEALISLAHDAG